jgi:AbrB family looped-hinge helix DNA binding protein
VAGVRTAKRDASTSEGCERQPGKVVITLEVGRWIAPILPARANATAAPPAEAVRIGLTRALTGSVTPCDSKTHRSITNEETAMRITSKGQVTIPVEIRERLGLLPNSEVEFAVEGNAVRIRRARGRHQRRRGRSIVTHLRGKATSGMTTDEIMALTRGQK